MLRFHPLAVSKVIKETDDAVVIEFDLPDELAESYAYLPGQHIALKREVDGKVIRRTYSICASVGENRIRVAVKRQPGGLFSEWAQDHIHPGDVLEVLTPTGRFHTELDPGQAKHYVAFAAGSGITPVISNVATILETEPNSRVTLFYGSRNRRSVIFKEALANLKDQHLDRFSLHHILSAESQDIELYEGRIDAQRCRDLWREFVGPEGADECFVCGPTPMIDEIVETLVDLGVERDRVHFERFVAGTGRAAVPAKPVPINQPKSGANITVIIDGSSQSFVMPAGETSILDAAASNGIELPFSCKGGVCSTCRAKLVSGEVDMALNYALEPWELDAGFVLTCQARPMAEAVTIDFDH